MNTKRFTILHSNDMHGDFLEEVEVGKGKLIGGLALLSGYINKVRKTEKNVFFVISGSEQIHIALIGSLASAYHSLRVCPNRAIEGTKNNIKPLPLVSFSAIRREVKVFPVPQAMMSFPLSLALKCSLVLLRA